MTKPLHLGFLQMTSTASLDQNLDFVEAQITSGAFNSTDILVLPEMFAQFGVKDQTPIASQETDFSGPIGTKMRAWAVEHNLWIVAGTVPCFVEGEKLPRARCHVINSSGELVAVYDKIHLFDASVGDRQGAYRESDSYNAGSTVVTFESPWGRLGLAVCYDLRFPELFRQLNDQGAQTVIVPSAFTEKTGQAHWEVLCRARAVENEFFIAAVNQCGQHDEKRRTWGHSMLVDPWGVTESAADRPVNLCVDVDHNRVDDVRAKIPVNQNRRLV